ncbi:MAG: hypothetical protein ABSC54_08685 [Smithellaceae bacterium]|jgi:hypothetical protein
MNKQKSDQDWQQLQAHIEGFFGHVFASDVRRIEYRPRFITHLLEMPPSEPHQNKLREMSK